MKRDNGLQRLKKLLLKDGRKELRNPVYLPGKTCGVCLGTMLLQPGRQTCKKCDSYVGVADLVGSMIYGCDGLPSGDLLYGYKDPHDERQEQFKLRVSALVGVGILEHRSCAETLVGVSVHQWAAVPSLRTFGSPHPFREILIGWMGQICSEVTVSASRLARGASPKQRRQFNVDLFNIDSPVVSGGHVMLIDDTWVSGSHAQSVAAALKRAGASRVSILTVGRWLKMDDRRTQDVYDRHIQGRPYDPSICPWTAGDCPSVPAMAAPASTPASNRSLPIPFEGFSYEHPGRIGPACRMIAELLSDGGWYGWDDITAHVADAFELQQQTVSKLLDGMVKTGGIERSPVKTKRGKKSARRVVRLR